MLLCHVDVDDSEKPLLDINRMAVLNEFTLILAWSIQVSYRSKRSMRVGVLTAASFSVVFNRFFVDSWADGSPSEMKMILHRRRLHAVPRRWLCVDVHSFRKEQMNDDSRVSMREQVDIGEARRDECNTRNPSTPTPRQNMVTRPTTKLETTYNQIT